MTYKILLAHNYYLQKGGEDIVFRAEGDLLRENGHEVIEYIRSNDRIGTMTGLDVALQTVYSHDSYREISSLIKTEKPDIAHFHNTFPLISPAAYYACYDCKIPVVQSLHNFRLLCPAASFYRDERICEDCLGKRFAWPGIIHKCYHESRIQTTVIAAMLSIHKFLGTWAKKVDLYIAGTEFMRQKFIQAGLPADKVVIKPNFIRSEQAKRSQIGDFALFVGRLVTEKGLKTLLQSWKSLDVPLKIVGDGPLKTIVNEFLKDNPGVPLEYLGRLDQSTVQRLLHQTRFLVFPSEWYEAFPMIILDAFLMAVPVVASRLGAAEKIIQNEYSGIFFNPGNPDDLASKVQWAWNHPIEMEQMGQNARREYEEKYSAEKNYELLMGIYQRAMTTHRPAR